MRAIGVTGVFDPVSVGGARYLLSDCGVGAGLRGAGRLPLVAALPTGLAGH